MARTAAKDLSTYTHTGNLTWQDAVKSGKAVGVVAVLPCEEMLSPQGYSKDIPNSATMTYITVTYDKNYVLEYLHKKVVLGLGFMRNNTLDSDSFKQFIDEQVEYSRSESKRNSEADMIREAENLSIKYGHSTDYWLSILKKAALEVEPAKESVAADNGKVKVKAA